MKETTENQKAVQLELEEELDDAKKYILKLEMDLFKEKNEHRKTKSTLEKYKKQLIVKEVEFGKETETLQNQLQELILASPSQGKTIKPYESVLSDGAMRGMKIYFKVHLGFDFFASQSSVNALRRKYDPRQEYSIKTAVLIRTVLGRKFEIQTTTVVCDDVKMILKRRLESLEMFGNLIFDQGTGDNIVVAVTADKGADITKLCLIIENCSKPNSAYSLILLGWYYGNDDHQNLKENFGAIFDQLNILSNIEFMRNGKRTQFNVRMKLVGDCKLLSSVYHHPGQSSSEPCYVCDVEICKMGKNRSTIGSFNLDQCGQIRTLEKMRKEGFQPLLCVEPEESEPPPLHIFMGLVQKYIIEPLLALCNQLDFTHVDLPTTLKEQKEYLKLLTKEVKTLRDGLNGVILIQEMTQNVIQGYKTMMNKKYNSTSSIFQCSSPHCLIELLDKKFKSQSIFVCYKCSNSVHTVCSGFFTPEECFKAVHEPTTCCSGCQTNIIQTVDDKIAHAQCRLDYFQKMIDSQTNFVTQAENELKTLEQQLRVSDGETRKKLEKVLVSIGCDPRAHYQQMNGNQTKNLLKPENVDKVLGVFPPNIDLSGYRQIMIDLCSGMSFSNNEVKTKADIEEMRRSLESLKTHLKAQHPTLNILPKLHIYCTHLIPFLERNNNWGRISEQGMEAFHAFFNKLLTRYASVSTAELRAIVILQHITNVNQLTDMGYSW
ncbi:unnamed protein product [Caenorhabditis nigoni]